MHCAVGVLRVEFELQHIVMNTVRSMALLTVLMPVASSAAPGDSSIPTANSVEQAPQKVVISVSRDAYDPRRDDTASKSLVTQAEIEKYGDTSVLDILRRVPGITVNGTGVQMRGLGRGYTQVLVNGDRPPPGFAIADISPTLIERIEVVRVATADLSTQAIAGTINIILKRTLSPAKNELRLGYGGERNDHGPNVSMQIADKKGDLGYGIGISARHSDEHRVITDEELGREASGRLVLDRYSPFDAKSIRTSSLSLVPRISFSMAGGDQLTLQSYLFASRENNFGDGYTRTNVGLPPPYPLVRYVNAIRSERARLELNWIKNFEKGKLEAKFTGGAGSSERDILGEGRTENTEAQKLSRTLRENEFREYTTMGKFIYRAKDTSSFSAGWDAGYKTTDGSWQQGNELLPGGTQGTVSELSKATVSRLALFAQDEWILRPGWSVYTGARWEGVETKTAGTTYAEARSRSSVFSPLIQSLYKLPGKGERQVRLALTRTYKTPATEDLVPARIPSINNSPSEPDVVGNPALGAELATGIDAAYEHFWSEGAMVSVSASQRRIKNNIRHIIIEESPGYWTSLPMNGGDAVTRSLEIETKFSLRRFLAEAPPVDIRTSINRNWSKVKSVPGPHNTLAQQVPLSATISADLKTGAFAYGATFVYRRGGLSRVTDIQISYLQPRRELDAYASWAVSRKSQLRLSVSNLTGVDRITENEFVEAIGQVRRINRVPYNPKVIASFTYKF